MVCSGIPRRCRRQARLTSGKPAATLPSCSSPGEACFPVLCCTGRGVCGLLGRPLHALVAADLLSPPWQANRAPHRPGVCWKTWCFAEGLWGLTGSVTVGGGAPQRPQAQTGPPHGLLRLGPGSRGQQLGGASVSGSWPENGVRSCLGPVPGERQATHEYGNGLGLQGAMGFLPHRSLSDLGSFSR